jgi:hypothetical protein
MRRLDVEILQEYPTWSHYGQLQQLSCGMEWHSVPLIGRSHVEALTMPFVSYCIGRLFRNVRYLYFQWSKPSSALEILKRTL